MARLQLSDLALEVEYVRFEDGWVVYDIRWLWQDEPILNDAILKRHNEFWGSRSRGGIHANEHRGDFVLPILKQALESDEPVSWNTTDPDVLLMIYPHWLYPLPKPAGLASIDWELGDTELPKGTWAADHLWAEREQRRKARSVAGKLPDDLFYLVLFVDVYNFKQCYAYEGNGVALHARVQRWQLEEFYQCLKGEYLTFKQRWKVDEFNREQLGEDWIGGEL